MKNQIQGLFDKDSRTFKDLVSFQGVSRPCKSEKKFKDRQEPWHEYEL